jgi:D-alanyl-lipoteichoic acid acyltransferase DltB (MBOAT superfamily)
MLFTSATFIVFLALVFALYWSLPSRRLQNGLLAAASYVFYAWWDYRFCGLMFLHCLVDFTLARALGRFERPRVRRALLLASIAFNVGLLGFFKYFHFFQDNLVALLGRAGWHVHPWTVQIILPVGISFYTFQSLGYTIDVYRRQLQPCRNFLDYLAFVAFFPQLIAGPIERAGNLLPQFDSPRTFDRGLAVDGCRLILLGFAKKLILAGNLAPWVDHIFAQPLTFPGWILLQAVFLFAFQIYCDFSAYSDIAIGTARLFGFTLMRNFDCPYFATDPVDFWRRWHISLSAWFRDYVFVPLALTCRNVTAALLVTFLLSGLWHGASWRFVAWGALHGAGVAACSLWRRGVPALVQGGWLASCRAFLGWAATFAFVCAGWIFFRAASFREALRIGKRIVSSPYLLPRYELLGGGEPLALVAAFVLLEWLQRRRPHALALDWLAKPARWAAYTALLWASLYWHRTRAVPFIYFQF